MKAEESMTVPAHTKKRWSPAVSIPARAVISAMSETTATMTIAAVTSATAAATTTMTARVHTWAISAAAAAYTPVPVR